MVSGGEGACSPREIFFLIGVNLLNLKFYDNLIMQL